MMTSHPYQENIGQDGLHREGLHGDALLIIFYQQGAVTDGCGCDVDEPLKHETALGVDEDHLTSDSPETLRDLDVYRELQAESVNQ